MHLEQSSLWHPFGITVNLLYITWVQNSLIFQKNLTLDGIPEPLVQQASDMLQWRSLTSTSRILINLTITMCLMFLVTIVWLNYFVSLFILRCEGSILGIRRLSSNVPRFFWGSGGCCPAARSLAESYDVELGHCLESITSRGLSGRLSCIVIHWRKRFSFLLWYASCLWPGLTGWSRILANVLL